MGRLVSNIVLSAAFILMTWALVRPFMADVALKEAGKLNAAYRWDAADKKAGLVARLNPLSAENNAAIGRLYMARASIAKAKTSFLLKAESKYKRAYQLNPYDTVNLLEFAALEKELFLAEPPLYNDRLSNALGLFNKVFVLDPKNYIINYEIGRNYVELWGYIGDKDKDFALDRFRSCLESAPWYAEGVYYMLWSRLRNFDILLAVTPKNPVAYQNLYDFVVRNELWNCRKAILDIIHESKKRTAAGPEWSGRSKSGGDVYENGNMYWTGTASRTIKVPKGKVIIRIKARGDESRGVWPYMIVELDGQEIGETFVDSTQWKEYEFKDETVGGIKVLSVTFPNDGGDEKKGTDRNLYVGEVVVQKYE